jgi:hypothetical protein
MPDDDTATGDQSLETQDPDLTDESDSDGEDQETNEPLNEGGKKALDAERKRVRELKAEVRKLKAQTKSADSDTDDVRSSVRAEITQEFGVKLAREKAVNILAELGYRGSPERGAKHLDLDDVVTDGEVDVKALRDVVTEWKDDEPDLFSESAGRARVTGSADLGKKSTPKRAKTAVEQMAALQFSRSRH